MLFSGFLAIFSLTTLSLILVGVILGIIFGSIPGLTTAMAIVLCLPMTFGMEPISGMALLIGIYIGGFSGGLISAILLKIPGTPASIATTFDGHPMAQNGKAGKALGLGIVFSFLGGLISILILIFVSPVLADFALQFGPYEYFALAFFALTMIASVAGKSLTKGLISGFIGMLLAMIGSAPIDGYPRLTFGLHYLDAGFELVPAIIGLFAVSELFKIAEHYIKPADNKVQEYKIKGFGFSIKEFREQTVNFFRSSIMGTGIGVLPGIGGALASLMAYLAAKNSSKHPEKFGTGINEGVVASESANNAAIGGALIPLLTLGIPGDTVTALLLGALTIHGITPGPLLFQTNGSLVYAIFAALIIANIFMVIVEFFGMRVFVKLLKIPKILLMPVIITICVVGAYSLNGRIFDIVTILIFGLIGYVMERNDLPLSPAILGFILGPITELNLRRGLMYSNGNFLVFFTKPISGVLLVVSILFVFYTFFKHIRETSKAA